MHCMILGALGGALLVAAAGCSSPPASKSCSAYAPPAGTDLSQPAVSFTKDVVPILVASCAFSSCHGAQNGSNNGVYLGAKDSTLDVARLYAGAVGVRANELPTMSYVTASDPANSYLMHKMDGDICSLAARCTNGDCQGAMPLDSDTLPVATRDTVRRWISQGAKND